MCVGMLSARLARELDCLCPSANAPLGFFLYGGSHAPFGEGELRPAVGPVT